MILVDTSVWVDHLCRKDPSLTELLNENRVCMHPFVAGEIAMGNLKNRDRIMEVLQDLPQVCVATEVEAMRFIDQNKLYGIGIGYVDAHLLAATKLTGGCTIWTRDKRLHTASERLHLAANFYH